MSNSLTINGKSSGLSCSYAGGCLFSVEAEGLASLLAADSSKNYIEVCNKKCEYSSADSTSTEAKCFLPAISTVYSNENFKIQTESENLKGSKIFGSSTNKEKPNELAFDGNLLNQPGMPNSATCQLGMEFSEGFVGMIS